jgi:gluconolactonase
MRSKLVGLTILLASLVPFTALAQSMKSVNGFKNPESVLEGADGIIYVSEVGEFNKDGDGKVSIVTTNQQIKPFATGLNDPKGLAQYNSELYVADKNRIMKLDKTGKATEWVKSTAFPQPVLVLNDLVFDSQGNLYVSDMGELSSKVDPMGKGAIFKITRDGKVSLVVSQKDNPAVKAPNGLLLDGDDKLLMVDYSSGMLHRYDMKTKKLEKVAEGFGKADGLTRDIKGRLYITDHTAGKVFRFSYGEAQAKPVPLPIKFESAAEVGFGNNGRQLMIVDMKAGKLHLLSRG